MEGSLPSHNYAWLYFEWKKKFFLEIEHLFGHHPQERKEEEIATHFLVIFIDALIEENVKPNADEYLVRAIETGAKTLTQKEWRAVTRYVMNIDWEDD